ncbi:MAG: glycosyl transferase family protein [Ilumatobacteraceae bacterium]|nr:glycosyl transferase family protein [Ilumatobacteraceae bacterium]
MTGRRLTHDVVICTRNRPDDLRDCLASLAVQTRRADAVRIVDASDPDEAAAVRALADRHADLPVVLTAAAPSTSAQRNLAVAASTADVIHFIDDDTVLEPGYLAAILDPFEADDHDLSDPAALLGVGGQPTNLPVPPTGGLRARLAPRSVVPGAVLASGRGVIASGLTELTEVDWLSGCAMSFRRAAIAAERFDESQDGYVLGEDLDAGYRIRQHGRLVVAPSARLEHRESARNRWARRRWAEADVVNRRRRVASGTGRYSARAFWTDGLAQLAHWSVRAARPGASDARAMASGIAAGLWAARQPDGASPAPGPWPPSAAQVGEPPAS